MSLHVKQNGTWREAKPYVRTNGAWREAKEVWAKRGGVWQLIYELEEPAPPLSVSPRFFGPSTLNVSGASGQAGGSNYFGDGASGDQSNITAVDRAATSQVLIGSSGSAGAAWSGNGTAFYPTWSNMPVGGKILLTWTVTYTQRGRKVSGSANVVIARTV
jgi:hypothetical protein